MKLSEAFPSNFLKHTDIPSAGVTVVIAKAEMEEIGQGKDAENKLILSFQDTAKKLVTNVTNAKNIAKVIGSDDTDNWIGKPITLVVREVDFQGETTLAIRVSLLGATAAVPA